jgi:DNA-binding transcriptional regulator YhcF (GntR family)
MEKNMEEKKLNREHSDIHSYDYDSFDDYNKALEKKIFELKKIFKLKKISEKKIDPIKSKYGKDEEIKKNDSGKWVIKYLPLIPNIIEEVHSTYIQEKGDGKGYRFFKYYIYAIILQFELNKTDCFLSNREFCELLGVKDERPIQRYILELMQDEYIMILHGSGSYRNYNEEMTLNKMNKLIKTFHKNPFDSIINGIKKVIDDYEENISTIKDNERYLVCNFDKIIDRDISKIPLIPVLLSKMPVYDYLLFALMLVKASSEKQLKYSNKEYSNMLGCSIETIEKSISNLRGKYIITKYKDISKKRRDYITINDKIVKELLNIYS